MGHMYQLWLHNVRFPYKCPRSDWFCISSANSFIELFRFPVTSITYGYKLSYSIKASFIRKWHYQKRRIDCLGCSGCMIACECWLRVFARNCQRDGMGRSTTALDSCTVQVRHAQLSRFQVSTFCIIAIARNIHSHALTRKSTSIASMPFLAMFTSCACARFID